MKRARWTRKEYNEYLKEKRAAVVAETRIAGADPKPKRARKKALGLPARAEKRLVYLDGPVLVRIIGEFRSRPYDKDNLLGGAKALRDAICCALGRPDDTPASKIWFEYEQRKAAGRQPWTTIEIYEQEEGQHE